MVARPLGPGDHKRSPSEKAINMAQQHIQFTTARLLCAMATIAVVLAVLFDISEGSSSTYTVPPPRWFVIVTNGLTLLGLMKLALSSKLEFSRE
jgi:hypothetical protein